MKKFILFDVIFYVAIPYIIWNYTREYLGDYLAILLSTLPGMFYTIVKFIKERQFNIAGLAILFSLLVGTIVNLLSSSAENMLLNQSYLGYFYGVIFIFSILIKQPLALYFTADIAYLQGYNKESVKKLYFQKRNLKMFQVVTLLFVLKIIAQNTIKLWLVSSYGPSKYGEMLIYTNIVGWTFSAVIIFSFFYVSSEINKSSKVHINHN